MSPPPNIDPAYAAAVGYLIDGIGLDGFSATSSSSVTNLLDSVLRADAAHAAFESGVFSAQTRDANALTEYTRAVGAHELYTYQADRFSRIATPEQVLSMDGIERSAEQNGIDLPVRGTPDRPGLPAGRRPRGSCARRSPPEQRQADTRLGITRSLIGQIAAQADAPVRERPAQGAGRCSAWPCSASPPGWRSRVLVRRSVVRPVQALTGAAQQVAEVAGEELARVADDDAADGTPLRPRPIPVPVRDEIGELAEAFNQVQTTAAALLERQVLSRRNVAEMFGNVGRRVSNLTTRQLAADRRRRARGDRPRRSSSGSTASTTSPYASSATPTA